MVIVPMVEMSTFRHVNVSSMSPPAHTARNTGISRFKSLRKHSRILRALLSTFISNFRVIILMNTKMILAAIALSLSLAACAKKEEAAAPEATPPAAEAPAPDAAAQGDAASQAQDSAAQAPAETPPADQPPAQPQQQ
jgi:type IV secretory pathway VirB10-like protein